MRPSVAIIGSGAAGAFAHRACMDYGCRSIEVFTDRMGKPAPGAFFFHWVPVDLAQKYAPDEIYYMGIGTGEKYIARQWPHMELGPRETSSFPTKPYAQFGWDSHSIWDGLWGNAKINIIADKFSDTDLKDFGKFHDIVILTFPTQESVEALGKYQIKIPIESGPEPTTNINLPQGAMLMVEPHKNFIIYNGGEIFPWVRFSHLWGKSSFEYPYNTRYGEGSERITFHTDLMPGTPVWRKVPAKNFMLVGRFARWDRKYLSHTAYQDTHAALIHWDEGHRDFKELL